MKNLLWILLAGTLLFVSQNLRAQDNLNLTVNNPTGAWLELLMQQTTNANATTTPGPLRTGSNITITPLNTDLPASGNLVFSTPNGISPFCVFTLGFNYTAAAGLQISLKNDTFAPNNLQIQQTQNTLIINGCTITSK